MELAELLNSQVHQLRIEVNGEALQEFAINIAETTAKRIIAEMNTPDKPLTEKEVCKLLGKTRQTLAKYRFTRKLRYHRIGREIYYLPSELKSDMQNF